MRILGIDPGVATVGFGVIDSEGGRQRMVRRPLLPATCCARRPPLSLPDCPAPSPCCHRPAHGRYRGSPAPGPGVTQSSSRQVIRAGRRVGTRW